MNLVPVNIDQYLTKDLLNDEYRKKSDGMPRAFGHCYVACEALYHLGLKDAMYKPWYGKDADGKTHWWLVSEVSDALIDPTASQYTERGLTPPYDKGKKCGFLTKEPSFRAKLLMVRIVGL